MEVALKLKNVTKRFGNVEAVKELSFTVPKGVVYGFLGPNGSGKTTTFRMIMSIFYPDEGDVYVLGNENPEKAKNDIGYLPEERGLYKSMKVIEVLSYFGMLKGLPSWEAKKRAEDLLERFGLGEWKKKKCEALSKGMGQKVQLLCVLIHEPQLMLLDEPFSGLDPVNMEVMRDAILSMKNEGKTVVFSTHVMAQAEEICDYILLINKGKKLLDGPLGEVKRSGEKAIHIDYDGDGSIFYKFAGIRRINDSGKSAEIILEDGADPQEFLKFIVGKINIRKFDLSEPSLHEIFVRTVTKMEERG